MVRPRRLFSFISQDVERYQTTPGENAIVTAVRALYSHPAFEGVLWYRWSRFCWLRKQNPFWWLCLAALRVLYPLVRIHSGLELAPSADIGPGLWVGHLGPTVIHPQTRAGCHLTLLHGTTIGAGSGGVPQIGDHVSIGAGATVIGGITIGDHATIGAGAVVTKDVAPGVLVVGIPARPLEHANRAQHLEAAVVRQDVIHTPHSRPARFKRRVRPTPQRER